MIPCHHRSVSIPPPILHPLLQLPISSSLSSLHSFPTSSSHIPSPHSFLAVLLAIVIVRSSMPIAILLLHPSLLDRCARRDRHTNDHAHNMYIDIIIATMPTSSSSHRQQHISYGIRRVARVDITHIKCVPQHIIANARQNSES